MLAGAGPCVEHGGREALLTSQGHGIVCAAAADAGARSLQRRLQIKRDEGLVLDDEDGDPGKIGPAVQISSDGDRVRCEIRAMGNADRLRQSGDAIERLSA
jgi:hypothetical protein